MAFDWPSSPAVQSRGLLTIAPRAEMRSSNNCGSMLNNNPARVSLSLSLSFLMADLADGGGNEGWIRMNCAAPALSAALAMLDTVPRKSKTGRECMCERDLQLDAP